MRSARLESNGRSKLIIDWYCMHITMYMINLSSDDSVDDLDYSSIIKKTK